MAIWVVFNAAMRYGALTLHAGVVLSNIQMSSDKPVKTRIGISACLFGEDVRYGGGNKLDRFLKDTLGKRVEFVSVCPEVEL